MNTIPFAVNDLFNPPYFRTRPFAPPLVRRARFQSEITALWKDYSVTRYVHSLSPLTCSAALNFDTLALLAHSVHRLAHSLPSLPCGTVEILWICVHAEIAFKGYKHVWCRHLKHALIQPQNKHLDNKRGGSATHKTTVPGLVAFHV